MQRFRSATYPSVLVLLQRASIAFLLIDDLSSVLNNDLIRLKGTVGTDPEAFSMRRHDLDSDVILASRLAALLEVSKGPVAAVLAAQVAIGALALVQHRPVNAVVVAARTVQAHAFGGWKLGYLAPLLHGGVCVANHAVCLSIRCEAGCGMKHDLLDWVLRHSSGFGWPFGSGL